MQGVLQGTRLSFVVREITEPVKRKKYFLEGKTIVDARTGLKKTKFTRVERLVEEPGGFMVYFPRGHCIRLKDRAALRKYKLDQKPQLINLQGLSDPNSPLGQLMAAQDKDERAFAWDLLEKQVIQLATRGGRGNVSQTEQLKEAA